jgi:hypothetical protein
MLVEVEELYAILIRLVVEVARVVVDVGLIPT